MVVFPAMRRFGFLIMSVIFCWAACLPGEETTLVGRDGSVTGYFPCGRSEKQKAVFRFGLPLIPPERQWRENGLLLGTWVTNGIRYTQSIFLGTCNLSGLGTDPRNASNEVLFINIKGENTNTEYTEASAGLALELNGERQRLELKNGLVSRTVGRVSRTVCALEIPETGVKQAEGEVLEFLGNMPPAERGSMTVKISLEPLADEAAAQRFSELDFQDELRGAMAAMRTNGVAGSPVLRFEPEPKPVRAN